PKAHRRFPRPQRRHQQRRHHAPRKPPHPVRRRRRRRSHHHHQPPRPHPPHRRAAASLPQAAPRHHHHRLFRPRLHPHGNHTQLQRNQGRHPLLEPGAALPTQIHQRRSHRTHPTLRSNRTHGQRPG